MLCSAIIINALEMTQNLLETLTVPKEKLAVHFHDSQFQGIENVIVAMAVRKNIFLKVCV